MARELAGRFDLFPHQPRRPLECRSVRAAEGGGSRRLRQRLSIPGRVASARRRRSRGFDRRGFSSTCSARVGLIDPLALAEGAASGRPVARSSACIAGWAGTRSAIVERPAVTSEAMPRSCSQRHDERQRSRPMLVPQAARASAENSPIRSADRQIRHMDDQRIEARPALGFVDASDSLGSSSHPPRVRKPSPLRPRPADLRRSAARPRRLPHRRTAVCGWFRPLRRRYSGGEPTARMSG